MIETIARVERRIFSPGSKGSSFDVGEDNGEIVSNDVVLASNVAFRLMPR